MADKVRLTTHRGRSNTTSSGQKKAYSPKHNDREFDSPDYDTHIDWERTQYNQYYTGDNSQWVSHADKSKSFAEVEEAAYKLFYQKGLDTTNETYIRNGHRDRCKTLDDLLTDTKTAPEEVIYQIGNKDFGLVDKSPQEAAELLKGMMQDFISWHKEKYPQIAILDVAIHVDEATPHVHLRQCYVAADDRQDGIFRCKQEACLEQMGVELPDPSKKRSRYNNRKVTYTRDTRDKMMELAHERGFEIDDHPLEASKVGQDLAQWQREQDEARIAELEQQISQAQQQMNNILQMLEHGEQNYQQDKSDKLKSLELLEAQIRENENYLKSVSPKEKTPLFGAKTHVIDQDEFDRMQAALAEIPKLREQVTKLSESMGEVTRTVKQAQQQQRANDKRSKELDAAEADIRDRGRKISIMSEDAKRKLEDADYKLSRVNDYIDQGIRDRLGEDYTPAGAYRKSLKLFLQQHGSSYDQFMYYHDQRLKTIDWGWER